MQLKCGGHEAELVAIHATPHMTIKPPCVGTQRTIEERRVDGGDVDHKGVDYWKAISP